MTLIRAAGLDAGLYMRKFGLCRRPEGYMLGAVVLVVNTAGVSAAAG